MKVLKPPPIVFKCEACGATNEGEPDEFYNLNTMPPSWSAECAFCHCIVTCSPRPLIKRLVGIDPQAEMLASAFRDEIVRKIHES